MSESGKRIRRTPEQARRLILDAAEAAMGAEGPAGLRLAQVAAQAGISHPTLLHHFKSREGLIQALNQRTIQAFRIALLDALHNAPEAETDLIALVFRTYREGLAQRLVWMMQSGADTGSTPERLSVLEELVVELHALRVRIGSPDPIEDSRAIVHLSAIAAFGDALIGKRLRGTDNAAEPEARRDFEKWLGRLINRHVEEGIERAAREAET